MKRFDALIGGLLLARCHVPSFAMGWGVEMTRHTQTLINVKS